MNNLPRRRSATIRALLALALLALGLSAQAPRFEVEVLDHDQGLPQDTVNSIAQDDRGFLWVATFGGLARFDGFEFKVYDIAHNGDLPSNRIYRICADGRGGLWLATEDAGLVHFDGEHFRAVAPPEGRDWELISGLCLRRGELWVGHNQGLAHVVDGVARAFPLPGDPVPVSHLRCDDRGRLFICSFRGLLLWDGEEVTRSASREAHFSTWEGPGGRIYGSRRQAIIAIDEDLDGRVLAEGERYTFLSGAITDEEGRMWIAGHQIFTIPLGPRDVFEPTTMPEYGNPHYRCIFLDREGNIWIGTSGTGLVRLTPKSYHELRRNGGLIESNSVRICVDGGDGKPLCLLDNIALGRPEDKDLHDDPDIGDRLRNFMEINDIEATADSIYFTAHDGLYRIPRGGDPVELAPGRLSGIVRTDDGRLFCGAAGAIVVWQDGTWTRHPLEGGPEDYLTPILADRQARIWFVTRTSAGWWQDGIWRVWDADDGIEGPLRSLQIDDRGRVWLSSYGRGLYYIDGEKVGRISRREGLPDDSLGKILCDDRGELWINSNRGIFKLLTSELDDFLAGRRTFLNAMLVNSPEGNGASGFRAPDGTLWFPSIHGLVGVRPDEIRDDSNRGIPTLIVGVRADDSEIPVAASVVLPGRSRTVSIGYAAIHHRKPDLLRFRYRLLGLGDEWREVQSRREAVFGGLEPGRYVFQVQATLAGEPWIAPPTTLAFTIRPLIHETFWFRSVVTLALMAVLLVVYRLKIRAVERRHRREAAAIAEEARRNEERLRLEKELEESKRFESVGRLAGGIAHDFNNILMAQVGHAELIELEADQPLSSSVHRHVEEIISSCKRASNMVRQLTEYSRDHSKNHRPRDLEHVLDKVIPFLGPTLPPNIRLVVSKGNGLDAVQVDETAVEQLLLNLILNARDAMPEGGDIEVEARLLDLDGESGEGAPTTARGPHALIAVRDTGHGIPEENLERVFETFFTTKGRGTGLGLTSVRNVVDAAGGHVTVQSQIGRGTVFRTFLPIAQANGDPS